MKSTPHHRFVPTLMTMIFARRVWMTTLLAGLLLGAVIGCAPSDPDETATPASDATIQPAVRRAHSLHE